MRYFKQKDDTKDETKKAAQMRDVRPLTNPSAV